MKTLGMILGLLVLAGVALAQTNTRYTLNPIENDQDIETCAKANGKAAWVADLMKDGKPQLSEFAPFCLLPTE